MKSMTVWRNLYALKSFAVFIAIAIVIFCGIFSGHPLFGQIGGTGTIAGTVTDSAGAVVPDATITITNTSTGIKTIQQSTSKGYYSVAALPPGSYTIEVSAKGFDSVTRNNVIVDALATVEVNLALKVGTASTNITVTGAAPILDTTNSTLGETMRGDLYSALPLNMNGTPRDPTAFVSLVPGVNSFNTQTAGTSYASFNGGQTFENAIYIEGLPITDSAVQGETRNLSLSISVEAVNQFQVLTNDPPAMYNGQGVENYVLKSGTNQFHGSAYEFFRNTALDAAGYFAKRTPVEHQNEYGITAGGPIKKDKIFYFGDYDGYRFSQTSPPTYQTVPTIAERSGDFSAFPEPIYDPLTTVCNSNGTNCTRSQFPGNKIPQNRLSPVSLSLASYLPTPTNSQLQNNFLTEIPVGLKVSNTTDRVDAQLNNKHLLYGIFSHGQYTTIGLDGVSAGTSALPLPYTASRDVDEVPTTIQIHDVYTFTPRFLNQFGYSFARLWVPIVSATESGLYPQKAGLKGLPAGQADEAFPSLNFGGPNAPQSWAGTNSIAFDDASNTFVMEDNVQLVRGVHSLSIGGDVEWLENNDTAPDQGSEAVFNMNNPETAGFSNGVVDNSTGNSYASYLLGSVDSAGLVDNYVATTGGRWRNYALYAQDQVQASSRLALSLGVRYQIYGVFREAHDRLSFLDPTLPNPAVDGYPGALEFAGNGPDSCHCATPVKVHYWNFAPRIGFAYSLNSKTVISGGYAIMNARAGAVGGRNYQGTGQLGFEANPSFVSPGNGTPAFFWSPIPSSALPTVYSSIYTGGVPPYQHPPFYNPTLNTGYYVGGPPAGGINYGAPNIGGMPPYYENINFGFQRMLSPNTNLRVAYSGSNGHRLNTNLGRPGISTQINPAYLALGNLLVEPANAANVEAAAKLFPGIHLPYPNYQGPIGQMLTPFPQYAGVNDIYEEIGNSSYNSLQVSLEKQLSNGLTFNLSYVRSKEIDDVVGASRTEYNPRRERAQGTIDTPNWASGTVNYLLPFGVGHKIGNSGLISHFISNWDISGIYTFTSGPPLSITSSACNTPFTGGACYPDYNPFFTGSVTINGGPARPRGNVLSTSYINKNAFIDPQAFTFGNVPRTLAYGLRAPAIWNQDISLKRMFDVSSRVKTQLSVDAFNVFNTVNFGGVSTNIDSNNFGDVTTQSNPPRNLQLDARIIF